MRILRLHLRHYRGIEDCEVHFAPRGVTVVRGPNETGKSSLAESIDLLFDELDSTRKAWVQGVKPVHVDEGAWIEADVETGPYAFTYTKRFHRRPETRLLVRAPRVENRTGREAHERVREILAETLDLELWRALRVQQGDGLAQPDLAEKPALAAALDRAAGVAAAGPREESLLDAARAERARYFTATGRVRGELAGTAREAELARETADALAERVTALEADALREAALRAAEQEANEARREAELQLRVCEARFETVAPMRAQAERQCALRDAARAEERSAVEAERARARLIASFSASEGEVTHCRHALEAGAAPLEALRQTLAHAAAALAAARQLQQDAEADERVLRTDCDYLRGCARLDELDERARRLEELRASIESAEQTLAQVRVEPSDVEAIARAQAAAERARARAEAEGPVVRVQPERRLELVVDGRRTVLEPDAPFEQRVGDSLWISLPDVAEVTVAAGAGAAARRKLLEEAETHLRGLCAEAGVADHADAVRALEARRAAQRTLQSGARSLGELRGGLDAAGFERGREQLRTRVLAYPTERAAREGAPPLAADLEGAEARVLEAVAAVARARRAVDDATARHEEAAGRLRESEARQRDTGVRHELAARNLEQLVDRLVAARAEISDHDVETARREASERARSLEDAAAVAERARSEADPDAVEAAAVAARTRRGECERTAREVRETRLRLSTRLEMVGQEGLHERCQEASARAHRAERARDAAQRRSDAAACLCVALENEREAARRGYATPLREQIEALGREVFGADFAVELDDDLRVTQRVLGGVSLPLASLSAGAREQIGLLTRLACARLVGEVEGVPVILDDVLGHSDPERADALSRVLSGEGRDGQVWILTCDPARVRRIEGARVVDLARAE